MESLNEEFTTMVDPFQIYLQTLISQSLDVNFLNEIIRENGICKGVFITIYLTNQLSDPWIDAYFIESIDAVENLWILPRRDSLKDTLKLKKSFQVCL